jgi:hypothetical protein
MALIPSRRRRRKATRLARNLAYAEAALALARHKAETTGAAAKGRGKLLLAGGAAVAAGAAAFAARKPLAKVLPSRSKSEPATPVWTPPPPQQSNYDAPGPVANTATPIPAPDAYPAPPIDERAEEEAAAAEAAAIGGSPSQYAGLTPDQPADEELRPVMEAGGGEAEGQEQAEAALEREAAFRDQAPSDAERQIDEAIEAQDEPWTGETPEPLTPGADRPPGEGEGGGISGRPGPPPDNVTETPGVPPTGSPATEPETGDEEDGGRTWSSQAG